MLMNGQVMTSVPSPAGHPHGIVAAAVYRDGRRVADIAIEDAAQWAKRPGHVVWIGLYEPSDELLRQAQVQFGLHDLAIEDAAKAHQRPKIEQYGESLFIVARTAEMISGRIVFGETHLFVGRGFVVSVRHGASVSYADVRKRCEATPAALTHGEDYILYAILDFIVDNYMPVLETIRSDVEDLEDRVVTTTLKQSEIEHLYTMRRDLLRLKQSIVPLVEVCRRLEHADLVAIDAAMQPHFRDVTDHVRRVQEEIDAMREVLAFAFEANLMAGQAQQNVISRKLAAWAAILAVPTAIAGIYGMNFESMPELRWRYGYLAVLVLIALICTTLFWRFKKAGWLSDGE
ncbi:magnesium/cobalt transporter CorA [Microvirga pudoricolor]|uniref:magnesium/cobalt transporter CorA n=1 Tax=Microvirga pudoricolor TaxID=2778729 RepID=UPI00194DE0A0|nr:magnesium/cobalt transporter CorA [Microvirga pudoricolor]MBM6594652.1 magnesium/cobalt transporter CorA [Microvirga pudoricolor]